MLSENRGTMYTCASVDGVMKEAVDSRWDGLIERWGTALEEEEGLDCNSMLTIATEF